MATRMKKACGISKTAVGAILARPVNQEVTVIQRLQAEEAEFEIARVIQRRAEFGEVVACEFRIQQTDADAVLDELGEVFSVLGGHVGLRRFFLKDFEANRVQQQAGQTKL